MVARRLASSVGALIAVLVSAGSGCAAGLSVERAPAAWVAYAHQVTTEIQARLGDGSPAAEGLAHYVASLPSSASGAPTEIDLRVWIDPAGIIDRITFEPFADDQANTDVTGLLRGLRLSRAPPPHLLLPIRLRVVISRSPPPSNPPAGSKPSTPT